MNYKFKKHIKENKKIYITGTVCFLVAGITCIIMRGRYADMQSVSDGLAKVTVRPLSFFSKHIDQSTTIVNVVEREGRGHPGYITRCLETGELFLTQGEAAKAFSLSPANLSSHINGKFKDCGGYHFERVGLVG